MALSPSHVRDTNANDSLSRDIDRAYTILRQSRVQYISPLPAKAARLAPECRRHQDVILPRSPWSSTGDSAQRSPSGVGVELYVYITPRDGRPARQVQVSPTFHTTRRSLVDDIASLDSTSENTKNLPVSMKPIAIFELLFHTSQAELICDGPTSIVIASGIVRRVYGRRNTQNCRA